MTPTTEELLSGDPKKRTVNRIFDYDVWSAIIEIEASGRAVTHVRMHGYHAQNLEDTAQRLYFANKLEIDMDMDPNTIVVYSKPDWANARILVVEGRSQQA